MKLYASLLFATLVSAASAAETTSYLRKGKGSAEVALDRSHRDSGRGGRDHAAPVKHGQGIVTVHGMDGHPLAADVAIIEKAVVDAFNVVHPDSKWKMTEFHDTWAQTFAEEAEDDDEDDEDGPFVAAAAGNNQDGEDKVGDRGRTIWQIWGAYGGYWGITCELCREDDYLRFGDASSASGSDSLQSMSDMLGSSAVGDEVCHQLKKSGSRMFRDVYDCAMSTKPAAIAVIESLREKNSGTAVAVSM